MEWGYASPTIDAMELDCIAGFCTNTLLVQWKTRRRLAAMSSPSPLNRTAIVAATNVLPQSLD